MEVFMAIAMLCFAIALYFDFHSLQPVIEQDGNYWVIRVEGKYFVDQDRMHRFSLTRKLHLYTGSDYLNYHYCKFESKEDAELYFEHVCDYVTGAKYIK